MGLFSKKNGKSGRPSSMYSTTSVAPLTPKTPMSASSSKTAFSDYSVVSVLEDKDKKYKRSIRILRFISRLISLILSAIMTGIWAYALGKFYLTKSHIIESSPGQTAWPNPPILWPTYLLLGISITTFFMNLVTLITYCCGIGAANKMNTVGSVIGYILMFVHVLVWIFGAGAYKYSEVTGGGKDLWGYSCGSEADKIADEVKSFVDFGKLCTMQGAGWYTSLIQAGFYLLTFIVTVLVARRASTKKKLGKARQSMTLEMQSQFGQGGQSPHVGGYAGQETGTIYSPAAGKRYMPVARDSPSLS